MVNSLPLQIDNTQQPPASLTAMIPQGQIWKKDGKGWQSTRRKGWSINKGVGIHLCLNVF